MPKIRFYHIRTLLWTYLVWAVLNLLFALLACKPMPQIYMHPNTNTNYPLARVPLVWAWLHIIPLWVLIGSCWYGEWDPFIISAAAATLVAGFAIVAGLLIKGRWARFLIIIGMSIWFLLASFILGIGV